MVQMIIFLVSSAVLFIGVLYYGVIYFGVLFIGVHFFLECLYLSHAENSPFVSITNSEVV